MINIRIIITLLAGTLFFFLLLRWQGKALVTSSAPAGIVSLELSGSAGKTSEVLISWESAGATGKARNNILIDFLFIPFYALLFYTLCGSISVRNRGSAATLGVLLAFFSLIAGAFDVLENLLMMLSTFSLYNQATTMLTALFAAAKFALLALSLLYVIILGIPQVVKKIRN